MREEVEDYLLVECAKWRGELRHTAVAVSSGFDAGRHFVLQLEALAAIGLLEDEELAAWRERFRAAPDPEPAPDAEAKARAKHYLESSVGDADRVIAAVNLLLAMGVLSEDDGDEWVDRAMDGEDEPDGDEEFHEVGAGELRRVLLTPTDEVDGERLVSVELYDDGVIVRWSGGKMLGLPDIRLSDDVGTPYETHGGGAGGGGSRDIHGRETFTPPVPGAAQRLVIERTGQRFELELDA